MTTTLLPGSELTDTGSDGQPLGLVGRAVFVLIVIYLIMNRAIPDLMVLPIGSSVRPYELVLLMIVGVWALWLVTEPLPFPTGLLGLVGLAMVFVLVLGPFIHAPGMSTYQANGAERGIFLIFSLAGLFLASYHQGYRIGPARKLLGWVVAVTAMQAALGIYEFLTEQPLTFMFDFARNIGLVVDPRAIRSEPTEVIARLTGELRASTTAPHPIVLSSVIALAILIVGAWLIYTKRVKPMVWLGFAGILLVVSLPAANSRTGFVILAAALFPLAILIIDRLPQLIVWGLGLALALGVAFAVSPETPRLLLDSVTRSDQDVNTQIRLDRIERIPELMAPRPYLGAGYLTHDPGIQVFDNAYFLGLIEFGIVGLAVVIWWFLIALVRAWTATGLARTNEKVLTVSGVAAVIALLASSATFDAFTFDQFLPTCLVVLGLALGRSDAILRRERKSQSIAV